MTTWQCATVKRAQAAIAIAGAIRVRDVLSVTVDRKRTLRCHQPVKQRGNKMEYLIVFSVAAMMIAYVWVIALCLRNA